MNKSEENQQKKPYIKPSVTVIDLKPEEAVLGACKTASMGGPVMSGCRNTVGNCQGLGS